jgi:sialic acid synthase SpsE
MRTMRRDLVAMSIGDRRIGADLPPLVIAEIGINHGGRVDDAIALVEAAARAGAHAVKLQTIVADELVAPSCPSPAHVEAASLVEFFRTFELDEDAHKRIAKRARELGLKVLSTPFSVGAVDTLERLQVDAYKIASGDLTWDQLIVRAARTGRPVILSTGMSTFSEVVHAVEIARGAGARDLAVLHCVSAYPVPSGSENLRAIQTLAEQCHLPVGLSDHGADAFALPIAVALGASIYERHLMLEGASDSVDAAVSSTPIELARAIEAGRRAWASLGSGHKACLSAEAANLVPSRRSLFAARDLPAGTVLSESDLIALRPATGVPPADWPLIAGLRLVAPLRRGEPLRLAGLERPPAPMEADRVA